MKDPIGLVERLRTGDEDAWKEASDTYYYLILNVASRIVVDKKEAEDVVQTTMMNAFRKISQFNGTAAFSTWLVSIAMNAARATYRRRRDTEDLKHEDCQQIVDKRSFLIYRSRPLNDVYARKILRREIENLPLVYRIPFQMIYVQELSISDTAEALQITVRAVKSRTFRAKAVLRERLKCLQSCAVTADHRSKKMTRRKELTGFGVK